MSLFDLRLLLRSQLEDWPFTENEFKISQINVKRKNDSYT